MESGNEVVKKNQPYKPTLGIAYFEKQFTMKNNVAIF